MLATADNIIIELPQVGSVGFRRGTGQMAQVLRRNAPNAAGERTCMVKLYERIGSTWHPARDASATTTIEERDLFASEDEATHCGRKPRRGRR